MGGLLVRRYILQTQQSGEPHRLGKVITIASPYLGAADSTYKLYTGGPFINKLTLAVTPGSIQFLAPHFQSLHQLLPSPTYHQFRLGYLYERGDVDGNGISDEKYEMERIVQILDSDFPTTGPGTVGKTFHQFLGQDDWTTDQTGIKYLQITGNQSQFLTTDRLIVSRAARCKGTNNALVGCFANRRYVPVKGMGDGTVPSLSSGFGWNVNPHLQTDLAPPSMRLFVRNSLSQVSDSDVEHTSLVHDSKVNNLVSSFLGIGQEPTTGDDLLELYRPKSDRSHLPIKQADYNPSHYVSIAGQSRVAVQDQFGNSASFKDEYLRNEVPGLKSYEMVADDSVMLTFTIGTAYIVDFIATINPMEVEIVSGVGNQTPDRAVRFMDQDFPANTPVRINISQTGVIDLRLDLNGDGTYETLITPTVNVSGTSANDTTPPKVNLSLVPLEANFLRVFIDAEDAEAGVSKIWYSFDGLEFHPYSVPFEIKNASTSTTLYAFADDLVGNRSGLVSRTVSSSSSIHPIAECVSSTSEGKIAWFGYHNQTGSEVSIPVGGDNLLVPLPGNKGQPIIFAIGRVKSVFGVPILSKTLRWKLRSRDGIIHTAIASLSSLPSCKEAK